jgi:hypothetical protein
LLFSVLFCRLDSAADGFVVIPAAALAGKMLSERKFLVLDTVLLFLSYCVGLVFNTSRYWDAFIFWGALHSFSYMTPYYSAFVIMSIVFVCSCLPARLLDGGKDKW